MWALAMKRQVCILISDTSSDEQILRAMYNAAKDDKLQRVRHESNRTIDVDCILIVICIVLFVTHWRWLRMLTKVEAQ
jgi:hypothetical protein